MQIVRNVLLLFGAIALYLIPQVSFADGNFSVHLKARLYHITPGNVICTKHLVCKNAVALKEFYKQRNYAPIWMKNGKLTSAGDTLVSIIQHSYQDGLDPRHYHIKQLDLLVTQLNDLSASTESMCKNSASNSKSMVLTAVDNSSSINASAPVTATIADYNLDTDLELTLSDAFLSYSRNLYYSQVNVKKFYPYWTDIKPDINLLNQLNQAASDPTTVVNNLTPTYPLYNKLKKKLHAYQKVALNGGFPSVPEGGTLEIGDSGKRVMMLRRRLFVSGELSTLGSDKFDDNLKQAVMQFQDNTGLYDDGVVESDTLQALNVSINTRIKQIELNMDKIRLLPQNMPNDYVMVNLPTYGLQVVSDKQPALAIEVAVGGVAHPSCVLNSQINYMVLNPYWNIPLQIAESEIWPSIKKDPKFLSSKGVQVLKKNKHGIYEPIDPANINWYTLTPQQFNRYRFRQLPSSDNALGKVKFIFPNRCDIYLHDSNESEVFEVYERAFSHGCIRLSQPLNFTTYVLTNEKNWSANKINHMFAKDVNTTIPLTKPLPIYIMYFTAIVTDDDWLQFGIDIYHLDDLSKYSVFLPDQ